MIQQRKFITAMARHYGAPIDIDPSNLEASYRAFMEGEYSLRMHEMRTADKRMARHGDYVAPGINFLIGANAVERAEDKLAERRAGRANIDRATAAGRMDEYDQWVRLKHLLAILTGRYDGLPNNSASDPVYNRHIQTAYRLRKHYAPDAWRAGVESVAARQRRAEDWTARMDRAGPPSNWGKRHDPETREARWRALPVRNRISELCAAR